LQKPIVSAVNPYTFGKYFTDHMLSIDYSADKGWATPKIVPNMPFKIATTATSLHYGISAYEGISVVKNSVTGVPQGFRVNDSLKSFEESNEHVDMPKFSSPEFLKCIKQLVKLDEHWFPDLNNEPS